MSNKIDFKKTTFRVIINGKEKSQDLVECNLTGSKENFIKSCPRALLLVEKLSANIISSYNSKEDITLLFQIDSSKTKLKPTETMDSVLEKFNDRCRLCVSQKVLEKTK